MRGAGPGQVLMPIYLGVRRKRLILLGPFWVFSPTSSSLVSPHLALAMKRKWHVTQGLCPLRATYPTCHHTQHSAAPTDPQNMSECRRSTDMCVRAEEG